jgi:hypothetical protein
MSTAFEENRSYTYADYLEWDETVRAEIINGVEIHTKDIF